MKRATSLNLHLEYERKGGLEWIETRGRENTALDVIRTDQTEAGWQHREVKVKRTIAVRLMLAAGDFKKTERSRFKREDASFGSWKFVVYVAHVWVDVQEAVQDVQEREHQGVINISLICEAGQMLNF